MEKTDILTKNDLESILEKAGFSKKKIYAAINRAEAQKLFELADKKTVTEEGGCDASDFELIREFSFSVPSEEEVSKTKKSSAKKQPLILKKKAVVIYQLKKDMSYEVCLAFARSQGQPADNASLLSAYEQAGSEFPNNTWVLALDAKNRIPALRQIARASKIVHELKMALAEHKLLTGFCFIVFKS
jgi:hypothetical protein